MTLREIATSKVNLDLKKLLTEMYFKGKEGKLNNIVLNNIVSNNIKLKDNEKIRKS